MSILDQIVKNKREEVKSLGDIPTPDFCPTDFKGIFEVKPFLIAEVKAKSPSEGAIVDDFDPMAQASKYICGAANAISVLTDEMYFGGSFEILKNIRNLTFLPLLCKEFIVDPKQVRMARHCGADLVLLIVKILSEEDLKTLKEEIEKWGMKALIEVQNEEELNRALRVEPELLLINNRNLTSFEVDMKTTSRLLADIPLHIKVIAASGIKDPSETRTFPPRVDGFLIGTSLMRSENPAEFLRQCRET